MHYMHALTMHILPFIGQQRFSYCQYPFILSIVAKRHILTKDSEQQMILTARRSLVQRMARHQQPQIEIFFLNIQVD